MVVVGRKRDKTRKTMRVTKIQLAGKKNELLTTPYLRGTSRYSSRGGD